MSAITGIFMRNGKNVDPQLMKKMNDKLSHRGPDGSAIWSEGPVGLGHQMLWTTPESLHEKLPYEDDGLVITADARIDNRAELSEKLGIQDEENVSDSYFILKAYQKWGDDCPDKLLGDFAFAIWDKNEEKLFCARDHMGVKPFYYYLDDDIFVFGTEIKALFEVEGVPREINEKRLLKYLILDDFSEKKLTFFMNIRSFIAAHYLILDSNHINFKRYWKLDPHLEIIMDSDKEYSKRFLEIFTEAVKCRLRTHEDKLGVMLSGGLDSSSITCTAKKILDENKIKKEIHSFSKIFDEYPEADERKYVNKVIEKTKIKSSFIKCDNINPLKKIDEILDYMDQPRPTSQIGQVHEAKQIIQKNGIRIILAGEGGDQVVSHAPYHIEELLLSFKWIKAYNALNDLSCILEISRLKLLKNRLTHILQYYLMKWPYLYQFLRKKYFYENFINKKLLKKMKIDRNIYPIKNIMNCKNMQYYLVYELSSQKTFEIGDQNNSKFHIESRYPFFDKRLIEFCYGIPTEMKIRSGFTRYIMRIAMKDILPEEIRWRTSKANLAWISFKDVFNDKYLLKNAFLDANDIIKDYIKLDQMENFYDISKIKHSFDMVFFWRIILINLWLRKNKLK